MEIEMEAFDYFYKILWRCENYIVYTHSFLNKILINFDNKTRN